MKYHMEPEPLTGKTINITLSERNLRALLSKLEVPGSARTIQTFNGNGYPLVSVSVTAESDAEHYADGRKPGRMVDFTEEALRS
jgi:hypothetical protein